MASLVNVVRSNPDQFYRYKMERLQTKIEGKGNGIKTVVTNLSSVAQSLDRPPSYVIKYFGFELGAQTNNDPKDDRWIINGAHEAQKLQESLDGFIAKFVLCRSCKNPETVVHIVDDRITLDCKACGSTSKVEPQLKLNGFILKNVPRKGKKDKAQRRADKKAKQNGKTNGENGKQVNGENGHDSDDNSNAGTPNGVEDEPDHADPVQAELAKPLENVSLKEPEWQSNFDDDAVAERQRAAGSAFKTVKTKNVLGEKIEKLVEWADEQLAAWVEQAKEEDAEFKKAQAALPEDEQMDEEEIEERNEAVKQKRFKEQRKVVASKLAELEIEEGDPAAVATLAEFLFDNGNDFIEATKFDEDKNLGGKVVGGADVSYIKKFAPLFLSLYGISNLDEENEACEITLLETTEKILKRQRKEQAKQEDEENSKNKPKGLSKEQKAELKKEQKTAKSKAQTLFYSKMKFICLAYYQFDLVKEDNFRAWRKSPTSSETVTVIREQGAKGFWEFLDEAEDSDEEEEEEEEESEEDDE